MVAYQRPVGLTGLVVSRVRFVDHGRAFDPRGECFGCLRLVMNNLRMVELNAGLHHDSDDAIQRGVQPQITKGGFMGFQLRRREPELRCR